MSHKPTNSTPDFNGHVPPWEVSFYCLSKHACMHGQSGFFSPKSKRGIYDSLCQQTRKDKTNGFSLPPNEISILLPLFFQALEQPCRIFFLLFDRSKHFLFISNVGCTFPSLTIENQSIFLNNSNRSAPYLSFFLADSFFITFLTDPITFLVSTDNTAR